VTDEEWRKRVAALLNLTAVRTQACKACGRTIWFMPMRKSGKLNPYTDEAMPHFAD